MKGKTDRMDRLDNTVRPYAWGSTTAIPELLGIRPTGEPQAELWMGAHPGAPSRLDRGAGPVPLNEVIDADPRGELGAETVERFGPRLPFLFKILAAGSPLSVQVHPDLAQAQAGYDDEEARGIPVDAPHRNYRDANHKPEMICALGPFNGLCGFRPPAEAADLIERLGVDELKPYVDTLRARPESEALREVLAAILTADRAAMAATVNRAAEAAARLAVEDPDGPYAAAYTAYARAAAAFPGDPGVVAGMLLNHVTLNPGDALYLGAGVPHAYFDGLGVEIMANSDNVLRCGLTPKHIDVPELLQIVRFASGAAALVRPRGEAPGTGPGRSCTTRPSTSSASRATGSHPAPTRGPWTTGPRRSCCASRERPPSPTPTATGWPWRPAGPPTCGPARARPCTVTAPSSAPPCGSDRPTGPTSSPTDPSEGTLRHP